ncbi:MAG: RIP metalloprotease RseP, partial [Pseudomonadota bacterium]|nr:RIP metalloprotease RseP [Pseudomonadota bacterium]
MEFLVSIVGFIIAIGILVTFHEFGHYYVARLCNVKVLNFSIGFGKNIYTKKFKGNDTEYSIGLIPLGGYVKMLESSELTEKHSDLKFCFDKQNVYKRFLIVAAGPIFNLILAIIFFTFVHFKGISGIKPIVTSIDSIHNSGTDLQVDNMEIYKVNDEYTKRWQDVRIQILNSAVDKEPITLYLRDNSNKDFSVNLSINYNEILKKEGDIIRNLGIQPRQPNLPPIIGSVQTNSPASLAGLEAGDIIKTINDKTIESWLEWVQIIKNNPNQELEIVLLRNNEEQKTLLIPVAKEVNKTTFGFAGVSADTDNLDQHRVIVS